MIVTLSGASAVGKTTICRHMLYMAGNVQILTSYTTRGPRPTDLPNEYIYLTDKEFNRMQEAGSFLWTASAHTHRYGTTKISVQKALSDPAHTHLMILLSKYVGELRMAAWLMGKHKQIHSFYVLSPGPAILRKRLETRGDDEKSIEQRLKECEKWDAEAKKSSPLFTFIKNEGLAEDTARAILTQIQTG